MRQERGKRNNAGLSLVELVVVVLILGVMAGVTVTGYSILQRMNSEPCAKRLSAILDKARIETISRTESVQLELYVSEKSYYAQIVLVTGAGSRTLLGEATELGNTALTLTPTGGSFSANAIADATEAAPFVLSFSKSSGAFLGSRTGGGAETTNVPESIVISGGKTVTLVLVKETGRNYIE